MLYNIRICYITSDAILLTGSRVVTSIKNIAWAANVTLAETKNKTMAALNESLTAQQAGITKQATQAAVQEIKQANITQQVKQQALTQTKQDIAQEFHDLPSSIANMLAITIIVVIATPVPADLIWTHFRAYKSQGQGTNNNQKEYLDCIGL